MRQLTALEEKRLGILTSRSVSVTLLEPTATGLEKSILDATAPVRRYMHDHGIHDYELQGQGAKEHGVYIETELLTSGLVIPSKGSLYRPKTKSGDSRIWFKALPEICEPNDIIVVIAYLGRLYVFNLTKCPLESLLSAESGSPIKELIEEISNKEASTSLELLSKLKEIASRGLIPAETIGDTAIGRTLETALGIAINSSKEPDYKGIELKSYRRTSAGRANRKNLFAQVPTWSISKLKSSREILDTFGYPAGEDFKLYCTVSTQSRNSQGLMLKLDQDKDILFENSDRQELKDFVAWEMDILRQRLKEKHNETFWVAAESVRKNGQEFFQYKKVLHTKKPIVSQFDILLDQGDITLDHLIKRNAKGKVSEKGPLFKIAHSSIEMLFPPSQTYNLI